MSLLQLIASTSCDQVREYCCTRDIMHQVCHTRYDILPYRTSYTFTTWKYLFVPDLRNLYNTYRSFAPDDTHWKGAVMGGRMCVSCLSLLPPPYLSGYHAYTLHVWGIRHYIQSFSASVFFSFFFFISTYTRCTYICESGLRTDTGCVLLCDWVEACFVWCDEPTYDKSTQQ